MKQIIISTLVLFMTLSMYGQYTLGVNYSHQIIPGEYNTSTNPGIGLSFGYNNTLHMSLIGGFNHYFSSYEEGTKIAEATTLIHPSTVEVDATYGYTYNFFYAGIRYYNIGETDSDGGIYYEGTIGLLSETINTELGTYDTNNYSVTPTEKIKTTAPTFSIGLGGEKYISIAYFYASVQANAIALFNRDFYGQPETKLGTLLAVNLNAGIRIPLN